MKTRSLPIFLFVLRRDADLHGMRSFVLDQAASEQGPPHQAQPLRKLGPICEYSVCRRCLAAAKVTCWMGLVLHWGNQPDQQPRKSHYFSSTVGTEKAEEALVGPLVRP